MNIRDSFGNFVSLLNENPLPLMRHRPVLLEPVRMYYPTISTVPHSGAFPITASCSLRNLDLLHIDSFDSPNRARARYCKDQASVQCPRHHHPNSTHRRHRRQVSRHDCIRQDSEYSSSYNGDFDTNKLFIGKGSKRHPCRFRESKSCEKTFSTASHASRHSKTHTIGKAVRCTYPTCERSFRRKDNMKQHLETHYKCKCIATTLVDDSSNHPQGVDGNATSLATGPIARVK